MQVFFLTSFYADAVLWLEKNLLTCPSKKFLHIECPGCGLQRSYIALMKGDFADSFQLYPAAIPMLLLFCYLLLHVFFRFKSGGKILMILYIFCASIIAVHYIYKIVTHQNLT
ncbi:DUF2752 domain-containing protein [Lacibacter sediminis]|uniref:DUF2752 domain-containing protein n=1 Tax=Lacibacter sediminis TaxID=2760713 RepID=A0A7G5XB71_9BACT|nr:DUF2752 domain-containing protein [Lacibacter sediminis]